MGLVNFLSDNWETLALGAGGAGAWYKEYRERKKQAERYNIETKELNSKLRKLETENDKSIVELYQEALNDLKKRYDEKFEEMQKEINELREDLKLRDNRYSELLEKYNKIKKEIR